MEDMTKDVRKQTIMCENITGYICNKRELGVYIRCEVIVGLIISLRIKL